MIVTTANRDIDRDTNTALSVTGRTLSALTIQPAFAPDLERDAVAAYLVASDLRWGHKSRSADVALLALSRSTVC